MWLLQLSVPSRALPLLAFPQSKVLKVWWNTGFFSSTLPSCSLNL
jgi:hypothetical protein